MFLLVPAHPGCPGQNPQNRKMVVSRVFVVWDYYPGELVPEETFTHLCGGAHMVIHAILWVLWCKGKSRGRRTISWLDATPPGLLVPPPPSSPPFLRRMPFLPHSCQLILLGRGTNMLGCIPSGLVLFLLEVKLK